MSAQRIAVRDAVSGDFDAIYRLYCDVIDDDGGRPLGGAPTPEVFAQGWMHDRKVYVAESGGAIVGTFFVRSNFPAFVAHIAQSGYIVARDARRSGIGRRLVEESLAKAKELGYTAMMFHLVFESNPSRDLYEACGLQVIGRILTPRGPRQPSSIGGPYDY